MMSTQYNYAGIDIAKRNFVIAVSSLSKTKTETNNPKGIAHTIEYLKKHNVTLHVDFEVSRDSQVGCVAQPRTRLVGYAGCGLLVTIACVHHLLK